MNNFTSLSLFLGLFMVTACCGLQNDETLQLDSGDCPSGLIQQDGDELCAQCFEDDILLSICGVPEDAACFAREGPSGDCQTCETDEGRVVFDNCFVDAEAFDCELTIKRTSAGEIECEVCRAESGRVVLETCFGNGPEGFCYRDENGCDVCEDDDGNVLEYSCDVTLVAPEDCVVYGDANAECVDCFSNSELIFHQCDDNEGSPAPCERFVDANGDLCERCGNDVFCEEGTDSFRCETLDTEFETCTICYDAFGVTVEECSSSCSGQDCPVCTTEFTEVGACRVCRDGDIPLTTVCSAGGDVSCNYITPEATALESCLLCSANGETVWRDCGPPPVCTRVYDFDNEESCDRCLTESGSFSTCDVDESFTQCQQVERALVNEGDILTIDEVPARLFCVECEEEGAFFAEACLMDPVPLCEDEACSLLTARLPLNGCEAFIEESNGVSNAVTWFLVNEDIALIEAAISGGVRSCAADDCECSTGEVLEVVVAEADAARLTAFGFLFF